MTLPFLTAKIRSPIPGSSAQTMPPPGLVLLAESIRARLIVLSFQATRKRAMFTTGLLLF